MNSIQGIVFVIAAVAVAVTVASAQQTPQTQSGIVSGEGSTDKNTPSVRYGTVIQTIRPGEYVVPAPTGLQQAQVIQVPKAQSQVLGSDSQKSAQEEYAAAVQELQRQTQAQAQPSGGRQQTASVEGQNAQYGGFQPILYGTLRQVSNADQGIQYGANSQAGGERDYDEPINMEIKVDASGVTGGRYTREKEEDRYVRHQNDEEPQYGSNIRDNIRGEGNQQANNHALDFLSELDDEAILDLINRNSEAYKLTENYNNNVEPGFGDLSGFENLAQLQGLYEQAGIGNQGPNPNVLQNAGSGPVPQFNGFPGFGPGIHNNNGRVPPFAAGSSPIPQQQNPGAGGLLPNFRLPFFPQLGGNLANLFGSNNQPKQIQNQGPNSGIQQQAAEQIPFWAQPSFSNAAPFEQPGLGFPTHDVSGLKFNVPLPINKFNGWGPFAAPLNNGPLRHPIQNGPLFPGLIEPFNAAFFGQFNNANNQKNVDNQITNNQAAQQGISDQTQASPAQTSNSANQDNLATSGNEPTAQASAVRPRWLAPFAKLPKVGSKIKSWVTSIVKN